MFIGILDAYDTTMLLIYTQKKRYAAAYLYCTQSKYNLTKISKIRKRLV